MVHEPSLRADRFLLALRARLTEAPQDAIDDAKYGAAAWSSFMFHALEGAAEDCGMVSCAAKNAKGPTWARREYLFDVTWFRNACGDWETPELILEHENQWSQGEFLRDFWKLLLGYAPIRVMVGYCRTASDRKSWIDEINRILAEQQSRVRFPETVEDLILLGHRGMTTTGFAVYRRHHARFDQAVDSLDAVVMPDPNDADAWGSYIRMTQGAMTDRVHREVGRLQRAGIIDDRGNLLADTMPQDMAPGAETSVITG